MKPSGFYVDPLLLRKFTCFFNFSGLEWHIGRKIKNPDSFENQDFKWCHQESNRGHKDFQSFALPTELWHQHFYVRNQCFSIAVAKVRKLLKLANISVEKMRFLCKKRHFFGKYR